MNRSGLVVAGLRSGVGKTTVTLGVIRALAGAGRRVAAFKVGPDFLDPSQYSAAGASYVRNLDPILQSDRGLLENFAGARDCDAVVVEGAMGLFDGPFPGKTTASTADVARRLGLPILLVCDGRSCAQSIAAEILGAQVLLKGHPILGVLLNFVASPRHAELLIAGVRRLAKIRDAGCIFRDALPALPSRHLGLVPAAESSIGAREAQYAAYAKAVSRAIPIRRLCRATIRAADDAPRDSETPRLPRPRNITVAVAWDAAFSFYYQESLDYFHRHCRRVIYFSPLADLTPPDADLYYFGGGFPEVFAARLSKNTPFRAALRARLNRGAKSYAECGGLMYLSRAIITTAGRRHPMVGLLPGLCRMHARRQALGYWKATVRKPALFMNRHLTLIGHEYHWSSFEPGNGYQPVYDARKIGSTDRHPGGGAARNVFASYIHLSPLGNPVFFRRLLDWA